MQKLYDILVSEGGRIDYATDEIIDVSDNDHKQKITKVSIREFPTGAFYSNGATACFIIKNVKYGENYLKLTEDRVEIRYSKANDSIFIPCKQMRDDFVCEYSYYPADKLLKIVVLEIGKEKFEHNITIKFKK